MKNIVAQNGQNEKQFSVSTKNFFSIFSLDHEWEAYFGKQTLIMKRRFCLEKINLNHRKLLQSNKYSVIIFLQIFEGADNCPYHSFW